MPEPLPHYPFADLMLARRLELTEGRANAATVEARERLQPESGACWMEVAGTYAMFDGVGSPLTQTFGLGVSADVAEPQLEPLEAFFLDRGADVHHEACPLISPQLVRLLGARGYRPIEFSSVLYRPLSWKSATGPPPAEGIEVRRIEAEEAETWASVSAEGWSSESPELVGIVYDLGLIGIHAERVTAFLVELDGRPVAAGGLSVSDGVALLAGATTVPSARNRGAQRALLEARLRFARENGCDLAMMAALPGSASQRNAERQGFRIAYTRVKWQLTQSFAEPAAPDASRADRP